MKEKGVKKDTVYTYLKEVMTLNLQIIISNYFLRGVEIDLFFKVFSNVEKDPKSVAEFILMLIYKNEYCFLHYNLIFFLNYLDLIL